MKTKLPSAIAHFVFAILLNAAAHAQTTALTINPSTGQIIVPSGPTPFFDVLNVAGTPVPLLATPQRYGAVADGTSHPVSEWLTGGAHDRGYANLAAIQADYPHVVALTDEIDWAATQQALRLNKSIFLPSATGGYVTNRPLITQDDGQQIIGGGRQGPNGSSDGARLLVGSGIDGIRSERHAGSVRDLTVYGATVNIHGVAIGNPAVVTTATAHGLPNAPAVTGGWTITGNTAASPAILSTSAAHGLSHGDIVKISGSSATALNGLHRIIATDASGASVASGPWSTSTHFKILDVNGNELSAGSDGGACTMVRVYEVMIGPERGAPNRVAGSTPEILGLYNAVPDASDAAKLTLYNRDYSAVNVTVAATNDTGVLYTSRSGLYLGDGEGHDNQLNSPDPGHSFAIRNIFARRLATGFYNLTSDAGGGEALVAQEIGVGLWCSGNLDNSAFAHCWMTGASVAAYKVSRNGGITLHGGGGADAPTFIDMSDDSGNRATAYGCYWEGVQRNEDVFIEVGGNNGASLDGNTFAGFGFTGNHFHTALSSVIRVTNSGAPGDSLRGLINGSGMIYGDRASNVAVSYNGVLTYRAGDFLFLGNDSPLPAVGNVGDRVIISHYVAGATPGEYEVLNINGTNAWYKVGFDTLEPARGGTGLTSYTAGDLLYAANSTTLTKLAKGSDGQVLTIDGTTHLPVWAAAPGSVTTYTVSSTTNHNMSGTTLANVAELTIPNVAVGTYTVTIRGGGAFGPGGDAGWKWDLNGGTAVFSSHQALYMNTAFIPQLGTGVIMYGGTNGLTLGPTGQGLVVDGNIYGGEDWTTITGGGASAFQFDYHGSLNVTTAGSVIFRQSNHGGSGDTGTLAICTITLIKQ